MHLQRWFFLPLALLGTACTLVPSDHGFDPLVSQIAATGQPTPVWPGVSLSGDAAASRTSALLAQPLTEDSVVTLALLNNRHLRAQYFDLRAALGDYRETTALPNPFVSALVLEADDEPVTNLSFGLGIELLDILFLPRRVRAAGQELDAVQAETAARLIDFVGDVRVAYYRAVAAHQVSELTRQAARTTAAAASAAEALYDAGNLAEVDLNRQQLLAAAMRLENLRADAARTAARERMNGLLGLDAPRAQEWVLAGRLRPAPEHAHPLPATPADSLALMASDARIDAVASRLGMAAVSSLIGDVELEIERERDDGHWETGLGLGLELPLFNQGRGARQAATDRLSALIEQRLADGITYRAEARRLISDLEAARAMARVQGAELLPLASKVLQGTQLDYNAMQTGLFGLLSARQDELLAGRDYIQALEAFWVLQARYEQMAVGGSAGDTDLAIAAPRQRSGGEGDHP